MLESTLVCKILESYAYFNNELEGSKFYTSLSKTGYQTISNKEGLNSNCMKSCNAYPATIISGN